MKKLIKLIKSIDNAFWEVSTLVGGGVLVIFILSFTLTVLVLLKTFGGFNILLAIAATYLLYCLICFIRQVYKEYNKEK